MQMYGMNGEPLGFIGQRPDGMPWKSQGWREDFLAKPSVSIRRGIAWGFDPPYEDTDTLVLTSPSGKFCDVRIPKDARTDDDIPSHPSYWAFTGRAETTFHDARAKKHAIDMPYTAHCKFIHDIDSRGPGIQDEGDMFLLMNGDCVETGMMLNPDIDKVQPYKEYWSSPPSSGSDQVDSHDKLCVVAETTSGPGKGFIIKHGGYLQGVMHTGLDMNADTVLFERWTREKAPRSQAIQDEMQQFADQGPWSRDARSTASLPCGWLCMPDKHAGETIEHEGVRWMITELHA